MRRRLALTALSLALAGGMLAAAGAQQASAATAAPGAAQTCILGICIGPSSSPSPSPSTTSTPTPSPSTSSPNPLPLPSLPLPLPTGSNPVSAITGAAGQAASGTGAAKAAGKKAKQKNTSADPGLVASSATEVLTAGSATMTDFTYVGNANVPVAGGGTVTMMKFTADSITLSGGVTDTVTQGGASTVTSSPTLAFSGGVTLYATKLSGSLLGVPVTFTPSTISAILLKLADLITSGSTITLTNVTTDQPIVLAGALQTGSLTIS